MGQLFFQLLILREKHVVFLLNVFVLLFVAVAAQKHVPLVNDRAIFKVDEIEQNSSLLVRTIMQD